MKIAEAEGRPDHTGCSASWNASGHYADAATIHRIRAYSIPGKEGEGKITMGILLNQSPSGITVHPGVGRSGRPQDCLAKPHSHTLSRQTPIWGEKTAWNEADGAAPGICCRYCAEQA